MRVLTRSGQWSAADFAARFSEFLREYDQSPVREAPNARIVADFWNTPEVGDLPYRRGMLLATYWDARVRAATGGRKDFDDVLLWMQVRARRDPDAPAVDLLRRAMRRVARIDIGPDLAAYVDQGQAVDISSDVYEPCGTLEWVQRAPFHRGFDIQATIEDGDIVRGTIVDGPAWVAGLRDGMKLIGRRGGEIGDPDQEIAYEIEDGGERRVLRWMPRGQGRERFRRLAMRADLTPACAQRLGGA
jgi:predicted metalloprotease with PDZ domain